MIRDINMIDGRKKVAVVTGAGGFIGHHLVKRLVAEGFHRVVYGVDQRMPPFEDSPAHYFAKKDLREQSGTFHWFDTVKREEGHIDEIYHLAADMGGMGHITNHDAEIVYNNTMINFNVLEAAYQVGVGKFFFSSSVCAYPQRLKTIQARLLKESDMYPADPERGYGWEKLHMEHLCQYYRERYDNGVMDIRVARFHNTYGPLCAWKGGREKAPAAICRKIAIAKYLTPSHVPVKVEIWGDGQQCRTFTFITDLLDGVLAIMEPDSYSHGPMNLGADSPLITINGLARTIGDIANVEVELEHVDGPQGARIRQEDSSLAQGMLQWEPKVPLLTGLSLTYEWIEEQVVKSLEGQGW